MSTELSTLIALANAMIELEADVKNAEHLLAVKKEALRKVTEDDIPEAMESLGLSEFKLADGRRLYLEESYHPSIPKPKERAAFKWLRDNGFGSLIKRELSLKFGKGEDHIADTLMMDLEEQGYEVKDKESVHHSTLKAFVKEQLEEGEPLPEDLFGVYRRTAAKYKV